MIDNKLKTLLAVVQYGGYSRAAAALNLTQPAVSYHIKQLEEELGVSIPLEEAIELKGMRELLEKAGCE